MRAVEIPVLPELARIIAASSCGDLTFLVARCNKPFTANGFSHWFRKRCHEAALPQCAAGIRKAAATILAERGATDRQLMVLFGWESARQATIYTEGANRKKLAADAAKLMCDGHNENLDCPTELSHRRTS